MTLKALNLPPSRYLIYNHTVLKEDDLDTELDYADHNSYGFVIQIDRLEFQAYYNMIVSSPLVQDRFDDMLLVWNWRHVPVRDGDDCNFLVFHIPEGPNDVTGPLTYDEMVELFREHYQGYTPTGRLRLLVDCDAGQDGNIFITEYFPDEDSEDVQRFSRTLVLPNSEYVVTTYMNDILFGFRVRMQIPSGEPADASTDGYQVPIGLNDDLEFPVFGAPDQVISLEDLFGPDFK